MTTSQFIRSTTILFGQQKEELDRKPSPIIPPLEELGLSGGFLNFENTGVSPTISRISGLECFHPQSTDNAYVRIPCSTAPRIDPQTGLIQEQTVANLKLPPITTNPTEKTPPKKKRRPFKSCRRYRKRRRSAPTGQKLKKSIPPGRSTKEKHTDGPTEEELIEARTDRNRDALRNWYQKLGDLRKFKALHGHSTSTDCSLFVACQVCEFLTLVSHCALCSSERPPKAFRESRLGNLGQQATDGMESTRPRAKE